MNDAVSRETPSAPDLARRVFSHALPRAEAYAGLLAHEAVVRGLIGPREVPRLWERHLVNCALLGEAVPPDVDVCDVGTGAGLPGLVLAIVRPDLSLTLVEPLLRRTTFLEEAVAELGLQNVEVVRARAEELHGIRAFSVVTSRAVAPLERLLDWSMPLVRSGGALVAMKGSSASDEVAAAEQCLRRHGAGVVRVEQYGVDLIDPPTTVVRVEATRSARLGLASPPGGAAPGAHGRGGKQRRKGPKR
ncbi:MAG TPA: 16S rRNA (guanine(527)-N(7))-methyltransferase RsmG [Nocardioidaceae bacterium]|nr:16S rRNA (guanine(527)-N(7))-methyltransferase RsmG [Nocardioidaceae bacterium]